jgi:hypothetical protein
MLKANVRKDHIRTNPAADCERIVGGGRAQGILTPERQRSYSPTSGNVGKALFHFSPSTCSALPRE